MVRVMANLKLKGPLALTFSKQGKEINPFGTVALMVAKGRH